MIGFDIFYDNMYGFRIQITDHIGVTVFAAEPTNQTSSYVEKCCIGVSKEIKNTLGEIIDIEAFTCNIMKNIGYIPNKKEIENELFINVPIDLLFTVVEEVKEMVSH